MGKKVNVDFTNVADRGSVRVAEGDYVVKVKDFDTKPSKSSGNPMLTVTFEFATGEAVGQTIKDRHILTEQSLWTLRNMLQAMGFKVPNKPMKLDLDNLKGKKVGVTVVDGDEYKGRIKSEVADYMPVSAVGSSPAAAVVEEEEDDEDDFLSGDDESSSDDDTSDEVETEESEDEGTELSFTADDVQDAKAATLKEYAEEATAAGWDLGLGKKAKAAEVRASLLTIFDDEDDSDDDDSEMEEFSLEDV